MARGGSGVAMRLRLLTAFVAAVAACCALAVVGSAQRSNRSGPLTVTLRDAGNKFVGTVRMSAAAPTGTVEVRAVVRGLKPGFHGFHVHAVGACEGPAFKSAMGHLKHAGQAHGGHDGDLPSLLVKRNGTATLRATTDRFTLDDLRDRDGSAVMVHAGPDNYANIPPRYAPNGPDQETLDTGDSGDRVACGRIAPG
jgi:superoxide dismutase, Cu-Zn family